MVSPIAAARPVPTAGAARHGVRAGTNLLPRRFLWSSALGARARWRRPPPRTRRGRPRLPLGRPRAGTTSGASERAGASQRGRPGSGWLAHQAAAGALHVVPRPADAAWAAEPRGRGLRSPAARAPRGALGCSEPAHGHLHGPFAARSQPVTPRGQGPAARRARTARPEPPGLEALPGSPRPAPVLRLSPFHGFLEKTGRLRRARPCRENL